MSTIATSSTTVDAGVLHVFESTRTGRTTVQPLIGEPPAAAVTPRAAGGRTGRIESAMSSLATAVALEALLSDPGPFTLTDPVVTLTFVVPEGGRVRMYRAERTWLVEADYREVTP